MGDTLLKTRDSGSRTHQARIAALVVAVAFGAVDAAAQEPAPPAAPATADAASDAPPPADAPPTSIADPKSLDLELRTMEEDVNALKEQVFRSKAILLLLKEIVMQGSMGGSRATIFHVDELGASYKIESVSYYLDGQSRFSQNDNNGDLNSTKEIEVWDGAIPPGPHTLSATIKVRGDGMGLFSYVEDYTFTVQASDTFEAEEGKACQIRTLVGQKKGIARSFTERVNVTFETRCDPLEAGAP
jgi:hypothetical protein